MKIINVISMIMKLLSCRCGRNIVWPITNFQLMNLSTGTWFLFLFLSLALSSYTLTFSQKLDILSFIIYFLYFFGLFSALIFMKLKSFFIDVFLTLKIVFNKIYFYEKSFAIWFFIFLVLHYFFLMLYPRQRVTLLIQNQWSSQRKHHSDILYGSGSTRRGRPSTTIRNYSIVLSTRTCRATSLIIVVWRNVVYRSYDRFVHAFRETRLWLICASAEGWNSCVTVRLIVAAL